MPTQVETDKEVKRTLSFRKPVVMGFTEPEIRKGLEMQCLNCDKSSMGKSKYCSGACRTAWSRKSVTEFVICNSKSVTTGTVTEPNDVTVVTEDLDITPTVTRVASFEDYQSHPTDYARRTNASILNWGVWLNREELDKSDYVSNRVTIPGDWDYSGVGE